MIEIKDKTVVYSHKKDKIGELLAPTTFTCELCRVELFSGDILCSDCRKKLPTNHKKCCKRCGRKVEIAELCGQCRENPPKFKVGFSPLTYLDNSKRLVQRFKTGKPHLKEYFADLMTAKLVGSPPVDIICFVPMRLRERLFRGYNPSQLLANALSKRICKPVSSALKKVKKTNKQKTLSYKLRSENLHGAFKVVDSESVKGKRVLLVDDVMTTAATADEVSRVLLKCGAKYVVFLTVASTPNIELGSSFPPFID